MNRSRMMMLMLVALWRMLPRMVVTMNSLGCCRLQLVASALLDQVDAGMVVGC